jgi:3-oxosteroid 1-dehydrogenase
VSTSSDSPDQADTFDVIVVGGGAAGFCAAATAGHAGSSVVVLDGAEQIGGTTVKSSGGFWVPNNAIMRARGKTDPRPDALRHMAYLAFPDRFDPDDERLGLDQLDYDLIALYYDTASVMLDDLMARGHLQAVLMDSLKGDPDGLGPWFMTPYNKAPYGRLLAPKRFDSRAIEESANPSDEAMRAQGSTQGDGIDLIDQLAAGAAREGAEVRVSHRVDGVLTDGDGAVVGVTAQTPGGQVSLRARRGIVFTSGGFSHNRELRERYLRGPVVGSPAAMTSQGDFIPIAEELGAELGNMAEGWWGQLTFEPTLENPCPDDFVAFLHGDSSLMVNAAGERVANEKLMYNERTKVHFVRDADGGFPQRLLFMVYDEAVLQNPIVWPHRFPVPFPGEEAPHVIEGATLEELADNLAARLERLSEHTDGFRLEPGFADGLKASVERFNRFAAQGKDEDFQRGESITDLNFAPPPRPENDKNPTMFPLADRGPYYAVILGATMLDTKGGPRINTKGQIIKADGTPIPGLYGAGNCIASPAGEAYWGGGGTLGPALTFGYVAGVNVAREPAATP